MQITKFQLLLLFIQKKQIKNTHHSSGLALNTKNINKIQPDEYFTAHQILVRVLLLHFQRL